MFIDLIFGIGFAIAVMVILPIVLVGMLIVVAVISNFYDQIKMSRMDEESKKTFEEKRKKEGEEAIQKFKQYVKSLSDPTVWVERKLEGKNYGILKKYSKSELEEAIDIAIELGYEPVGSPREDDWSWTQAVKKIG